MKTLTSLTSAVHLICGLFILTACSKPDLDNLEVDTWRPEIASPLISSDFTARDIINKFETGGYFQSRPDQLITLVYTGELFSVKATDVLELPDIPYVFTDTVIKSFFSFPGNEQLTALTLNSGELTDDIRASHPEDVIVELTIPKAFKASQVFKKTILLEHQGNNSLTAEGTFSLDGYQFFLTGLSGIQYNLIEMSYRAYSATTGQKVSLSQFAGMFQDMNYKLLAGYLGERSLNIPHDSIIVDIFKHYKAGTVYLEDPKIKLTIENSFGIPVTTAFTHITGFNRNGSFSMTGTLFSNAIDIKAPDISQTLNTTTVKRELNGGNSNITNFLAFSPGRIEYGFNMSINASQSPPPLNYIRDSSKVKGHMELEIPLQGRIDHVVLEDTFDISFTELEEAESAKFKLLINNGFPLDAAVQIYFLDSAMTVIDSLLPQKERIFESGELSAQGLVLEPRLKETFFNISKERYDKIRKTKQLLLDIELISSEEAGRTVRFQESNHLSLKLGLIAQLNVDL